MVKKETASASDQEDQATGEEAASGAEPAAAADQSGLVAEEPAASLAPAQAAQSGEPDGATAGSQPDLDGDAAAGIAPLDEDVSPPLTDDMAFSGAWKAQLAVGRACFDDKRISYDQGLLLLDLLRGARRTEADGLVSPSAMGMHLKLQKLPVDEAITLPEWHVLATVFMRALAVLDVHYSSPAPARPLEPRKVPLDETTLELAEEPFEPTF